MAVPPSNCPPSVPSHLQLRLAMKCKLQCKVCCPCFRVQLPRLPGSPFPQLTRLRGFSFLDFCLFVTRHKKKPAKRPRSKSLAVTVTRRWPCYLPVSVSLTLALSSSSFLCVWQTFSHARSATW